MSPSGSAPKLIVAGATAYPRIIDAEPFREIADAVGAQLMFDIAHPAGLVAGGAHPNPVGVADVVTLTTHKTLRGPTGRSHPVSPGPRQGDRLGRVPRPPGRSPRARHRGQGGGLSRGVAPVVPRLRRPGGRQRAALAVALAAEGFRLVSGGTDNHLILVDLRPFDAELTGKQAQEVLDGPGSPSTATPSPTTLARPSSPRGSGSAPPRRPPRGWGPGDGPHRRVDRPALRHSGDEAALAEVRGEVLELCGAFPRIASSTRRGVPGSSAGGS